MPTSRFTAITCCAALLLTSLSVGLALPTAASADPLGGLFTCDSGGNKQEVAGLIGAGAGALLGSQLSKKNRALGAVLGAAAGAAIGSRIGCSMQETDKARARAAVKTALDKGVSQSWDNPKTGASGDVTVISSNYGPAIDGRAYRYAAGVTAQSSYEALSGLYATTTQVNLRSAPSSRSASLGLFAAGERVDALGTAPQGWVLVGRSGTAIGYIARAYLQPAGEGPTAACRLIETSTRTSEYKASIERYNACRDKAGEWQLSRA